MTQRLNPPDRGWTNPQRLLPESGNVEDVRRALNRIYDQLDRMSSDSLEVRATIAPTVMPATPGGVVITNTGGIGGGGTNTGGGGTGGGGGDTGTRLPVTFHIPENNGGVLTIDAEGYTKLQTITV